MAPQTTVASAQPVLAPAGSFSRLAGPLKGAILPLLLIFLWWLGSRQGWFSTIIPSPDDIVRVTYVWMFGAEGATIAPYYSQTWLRDLLGSFWRALIGFAIGSSVAFVLGLLTGWSLLVRETVDPTIQLLRAIPRVSLLPFAIIFLGLGNPPAIAMVAIGAFAQIYVQVMVSVQLVPRDLRRAAYMLGASDRQVLWRVVVPYAMPGIFAGLRLGVVYAWTLLVLAEMFAVGSGFGYTLWRSYEFLQVDLLVASVAMISISGWLSDRLVLWCMRRNIRWASAIAEVHE